MPDPLLYLAAMGAAASVGAAVVVALGWLRRPAGADQIQAAAVVALAGGLAAGYYVLHFRVAWPPVNGLDRLLTIVLPLVLALELVASIPRVPRWLAWVLRMALAVATGRILLHGSVYLSGVHPEWPLGRTVAALLVCAVLTAAVWGLLAWLSERSPVGISIPLALALTIQCAGLTIMLAGYLTGGAAALPISAALVGTAGAMRWLTTSPDSQASVGLGVITLSGLLIVGRFFGGLSTAAALVLLLAPLLCWVTELPSLRRQKSWIVGSIRLALVAIPLIVVLLLAKHAFDRDTAPLLAQEVAVGRAKLLLSR